MDFDVNDVRVSVVQPTKKRRASMQILEQEIVYDFIRSNDLKNRSRQRLVLIIEKRVVDKNEKLKVELREKQANRNIWLNY